MSEGASKGSPQAGPVRTIGFLGTGFMGAHMARRLAAADFRVSAWNRTPDKAAPLAQAGVRLCETAAGVASAADAVVCMLSSGPVCDDVLLGPQGVVETMNAGSTLVVMSSIPPKTARAQAEAAAARGVGYVDAPVSGGEAGARDGTLAIMAGGEPATIERLAPMFAALGRVTPVGPAGAGSLTKLANQAIVATTLAAVAEALLLAERGGADPARVREALLGGFADSTILRQHGRRMVEQDFAPGGPSKHQLKDTQTALTCAEAAGLTLPVLETVDSLFAALVAHGGADLDHSAVLLELRRRNGEVLAIAPAEERDIVSGTSPDCRI